MVNRVDGFRFGNWERRVERRRAQDSFGSLKVSGFKRGYGFGRELTMEEDIRRTWPLVLGSVKAQFIGANPE